LLIDAGITAARVVERLDFIGVDISTIQGVVISHAHTDHIRGSGVLHRKYKLPIWLSKGTYKQATALPSLVKKMGRLTEPNLFEAGEGVCFGSLRVETSPTPHDALDAVCFAIDNGSTRLGIMTDLGCRFLGLGAVIESLDGVLLESNYDEKMLENGPYPEELKQRIRSDSGHLSNTESADLLRRHGKRLRWACLGHLSENNNTPEKTLETHRQTAGTNLPLFVASRYGCTQTPDI
jgi:phosphoribosyl 1,2-cyclic phosphodiesterase